MEQINMSGKPIGVLMLSSFCPNCFTNRTSGEYFISHSRLPSWYTLFGTSGEPVKVPGYTTFNVVNRNTTTNSAGVPGEILCSSDGSHCVTPIKGLYLLFYQLVTEIPHALVDFHMLEKRISTCFSVCRKGSSTPAGYHFEVR